MRSSLETFDRSRDVVFRNMVGRRFNRIRITHIRGETRGKKTWQVVGVVWNSRRLTTHDRHTTFRVRARLIRPEVQVE